MALTFANPLGMDLSNFGLYGLRIYLQMWNTTTSTYAPDLVDMGIVENLSKSIDQQEATVDSARNGVRTPVKTLTQSFAETFTFDSLNVSDAVVRGLYEGSTSLTSAIANTKITIRRPGSAAQARLFVLNPGAPNTDSMLLMLPKVEIKAGDETQSNGSDPGRLGFSAKVLTDEAYKVPVAVLASNDSAPYGVHAILEPSTTAVANLNALVEKLIPT